MAPIRQREGIAYTGILGEGLAQQVAGGSLIAPVGEESSKGLAVFGVLLLVRHELDSILASVTCLGLLLSLFADLKFQAASIMTRKGDPQCHV